MENSCSNSEGIESWLKVIRADEVGPTMFKRLIKRFGSPSEVLGASVSQLQKVQGVGPKTAEKIARSLGKLDVQGEIERAGELGIWLLHLDDSRYPIALKKIYDPPPVLYVKGTLARQDSMSLAIVGSRRGSIYGQEQAGRFAYMLGGSGFTIVSGMARGIDTYAHRGALKAGGRTIAVQGCGLAKIFPPENKELFDRICENGACISELPLDTDPRPENFPARNRIIAGIAMGTLVIEAGNRSGAMITAKCALEAEREVMAVPGLITSPLNTGSHRLLKQGAKLVDSAEDIMEAFGYIGRDFKKQAVVSSRKAEKKVSEPLFEAAQLKLSSDEQKVFNCLGSESLHIDQLIDEASLKIGPINAALISLRLKGLISQKPGNFFAKN